MQSTSSWRTANRAIRKREIGEEEGQASCELWILKTLPYSPTARTEVVSVNNCLATANAAFKQQCTYPWTLSPSRMPILYLTLSFAGRFFVLLPLEAKLHCSIVIVPNKKRSSRKTWHSHVLHTQIKQWEKNEYFRNPVLIWAGCLPPTSRISHKVIISMQRLQTGFSSHITATNALAYVYW